MVNCNEECEWDTVSKYDLRVPEHVDTLSNGCFHEGMMIHSYVYVCIHINRLAPLQSTKQDINIDNRASINVANPTYPATISYLVAQETFRSLSASIQWINTQTRKHANNKKHQKTKQLQNDTPESQLLAESRISRTCSKREFHPLHISTDCFARSSGPSWLEASGMALAKWIVQTSAETLATYEVYLYITH